MPVPEVQRTPGLCYCNPNGTGHVHGAPVDPETWARGVLAIDAMAGQYPWAPRLSRRNRAAARRILAKAPA